MSISRLSAFQAYDYYNTIAAQRNLTTSEQTFYDYAKDNHSEICNEEMDEDKAGVAILIKATELLKEANPS